jgi:hypothetical protein
MAGLAGDVRFRRKSVQSVIVFVCLSAMGVSVIGLSCLNLYHWYLTGDLWVASE